MKKLLLQADFISLEDLLKKVGKVPGFNNIMIIGSWRDYGDYGATCACIEVYQISEEEDPNES